MAELREAGRSSVGQAFRQMWRPPLRFESPVQEKAFLYVYCRHFAAHRRLALMLGLLAGVLFLALDLFVASDLRFGHALPLVIGNRIASILVLVLFLGLAVSARFEVSERYAGGVLFAAVVVGFLLNCRGFLIAPHPYDYMYFFMGMCIDIMFGFAMLRLQARLVLMQTALCLLAAGIAIAWNRDLEGVDPHVLHVYQVTAMSLLLTVAAIGCAVANQLEGNARAAFAYTGALAASNERLALRSEEVERLNLALRQAVERAQRESKARARVLASASHDLRQPLHALSLYSALLAANPAPETCAKWAAISTRSPARSARCCTVCSICRNWRAGTTCPCFTACAWTTCAAACATSSRGRPARRDCGSSAGGRRWPGPATSCPSRASCAT